MICLKKGCQCIEPAILSWFDSTATLSVLAGSLSSWITGLASSHATLHTEVPTLAGTKGCGSRTLCALLTSLDVANGMKLLHKVELLHGYLAPHNVMLYSSPKVCDPANPILCLLVAIVKGKASYYCTDDIQCSQCSKPRRCEVCVCSLYMLQLDCKTCKVLCSDLEEVLYAISFRERGVIQTTCLLT